MRTWAVTMKSTATYIERWEWVEETMVYICTICGRENYKKDIAVKCCQEKKCL